MGNIIFWSFFSFFGVLGVYLIADRIINRILEIKPSFVLLTVRNCENDIEYSLRSLLRKYPSSEIIVADKNSEDRTLEIAYRMAARYSRIRVEGEAD